MDKKNTTIGVILLLAGIAGLFYSAKQQASRPVPPPAATASSTPASVAPAAAGTATPAQAVADVPPPANAAFASIAKAPAAGTVTTLSNDVIAVNFTSDGGSIRDIALKHFPATLGGHTPIVLNELHADPMLGFVDLPGLDRRTPYELVSATATEVVYRATFNHAIEVTRRYTLTAPGDKSNDPYQIRHETTFRNLTAAPAAFPRFELSLGTAAPVDEHDLGTQLTSGHSNGEDHTFTARNKLEASGGFLGMGAHGEQSSITAPGPIVWASTTNRFFATILTPDEPAAGTVTRRVKIFPDQPDTNHNAFGLAEATQFDLKTLPAHGTAKVGLNFYAGPKEYSRLSQSDYFKANQDKVMQFGFFKWFSQLLLVLMTWMHHLVPNWGVAIILTTLSLKIVFLPLTLKASKSMKRMAKLAPEMTALREKFKDNPAKQQTALMELYKAHKINPLGGCIPMLLPLPFFFGFFQMLQGTSELRFAPFLWVHDLAATDTVTHLFGFPINVLPILFTAVTFVQMHITPTPNMDNAQAKMMKFMPLIFLVFYYSMPAALSLYSAVNGLFTIGQQIIINRMKDDGDPIHAAPAAGPGGKPIKNVTPPKKK
ncbi:MAG: membrane protein insertase YidC [Verrucomicrobia bacterium]|nr:membrane protein insertase YidC [Verrucomicrobiota bacterium]